MTTRDRGGRCQHRGDEDPRRAQGSPCSWTTWILCRSLTYETILCPRISGCRWSRVIRSFPHNSVLVRKDIMQLAIRSSTLTNPFLTELVNIASTDTHMNVFWSNLILKTYRNILKQRYSEVKIDELESHQKSSLLHFIYSYGSRFTKVFSLDLLWNEVDKKFNNAWKAYCDSYCNGVCAWQDAGGDLVKIKLKA